MVEVAVCGVDNIKIQRPYHYIAHSLSVYDFVVVFITFNCQIKLIKLLNCTNPGFSNRPFASLLPLV